MVLLGEHANLVFGLVAAPTGTWFVGLRLLPRISTLPESAKQ